MKAQINELSGNNGFLIRNHYGEVYKTVVSWYEGKFHFNTRFITRSSDYVMDGVKLSKIPGYLKRHYFLLMKEQKHTWATGCRAVVRLKGEGFIATR